MASESNLPDYKGTPPVWVEQESPLQTNKQDKLYPMTCVSPQESLSLSKLWPQISQQLLLSENLENCNQASAPVLLGQFPSGWLRAISEFLLAHNSIRDQEAYG